MSLHDSSNGYNGLLKISIVYILPIVLGIYFVSDREKFYYVIRYSVRSKYNTIRCLKVIIVSISFCIIHQIIDFIYIVYNFEFELLFKYNFIQYTVLFTIIISLFFIQTGFLYQIINDLIKIHLVSILITLATNYIQYIFIKYYIINFWIPCIDITAAFEYLSKNLNLTSILIVVFKELLFTISLYLLSQIIFEKKDIIKK